MPSIPINYLDFAGLPAPLIAGIVAENKSRLKDILTDDRVKDALKNGMTILNLDSGTGRFLFLYLSSCLHPNHFSGSR